MLCFRCEGFKDSVVHAGFSHGGDFLAAADMSGLIRVWKMASKEKVWEFETSDITVRRSTVFLYVLLRALKNRHDNLLLFSEFRTFKIVAKLAPQKNFGNQQCRKKTAPTV